ncbi:MAG: alginate export family protein [Candidatus Sumerlaeaceae bacterium]
MLIVDQLRRGFSALRLLCWSGIAFVIAGAASGFASSTSNGDGETTGSANKRTGFFPPLVWGQEREWKLQMQADQRVRFERRDNYDLDKRKADNDDLGLVRTRVKFDLTYRTWWRVHLGLVDARQVGARTDIMQEAYWHLHQLFVEAKAREGSPWTITVGRQSFDFGEGRLVEYGTWANFLKLFDGARLRYQDSGMDVSLFLVQPLIYQHHHTPFLVTGAPHPQRHTFFYGVYSTFKWWAPHEVDLYALGLSDRSNMRTFPSSVKSEAGEYGTSSRYTLGTRLRGPLVKHAGLGTLGYGLEAAYQWGNVSGDTVRAYMVHADLNYTWNSPWKPMLKIEGNLASGDRRFGDGENNTFNPLFGSSHTPYGIIDFVRLQNLREVALNYSIEPTSKLKLQAEAHHYWLDSRTDAWFGGPGLRDKTGQSGRDLGDELSLVAKYKLTKRVSLEGGFSHFFPGNFPRKAGKTDGANFFYLQYELQL